MKISLSADLSLYSHGYIYLLLICCLVIPSTANGQESIDYYFKIKGEKIEFGAYHSNEKKGKIKLKKKSIEKKNTEIGYEEDYIAERIKENGLTLIYIHALCGQNFLFWRKRIKKLKELQSVDQFIHILWHPKYWLGFLKYQKNWEETPSIGKKLRLTFCNLIEVLGERTSLICHSSGNRILKGILENTDSAGVKLAFENVIMAAPDIDVNSFQSDFNSLLDKNKFTVYTNMRDVGLMRAVKRRGANPVGLFPGSLFVSFNGEEKMTIVDGAKVLTEKDRKIWNGQGHTQYKSNAQVFSDINRVLKGLPPIENKNLKLKYKNGKINYYQIDP